MKMMRIVFGFVVLVMVLSGFQDGVEIPFIEPESELVLDGTIPDVAWHPDGEVLAAVVDRGIKIFDVQLQVIAEFTPDEGAYIAVAWSPGGEQLIGLGHLNQTTIFVWDYDGVDQQFTLNTTFAVAGDPVYIMALSPDGRMLAGVRVWSEGTDSFGRLLLWDAETWEETETSRAFEWESPGSEFAWSPDSTAVAIGGSESVFVYSIAEQEVLWTLPLSWNPSGVAWASNNTLAITDLNTMLVDGASGEVISEFDYPPLGYSVLMSPDGRYVLVDLDEDTSGILDVTTGELLRRFALLERWGLDWSPDGARMAIGSLDGVLKVWNVSDLVE